jgi:hypothetical protein
MWTCPKCRSDVPRSLEVCWSCGTTPEGDEDPSFLPADDTPPILDPPGHDPGLPPELEDGLPEPEPEAVVCYETWREDTAIDLARQMQGEGIRARIASNYCRIEVHPDDLTRAQAWLLEYEQMLRDHERRRARRRRQDDTLGAMLLGGYLAMFPGVLVAALSSGLIWFLTHQESPALIAGTGFGVTAWGYLMTRLYQARRTAAALREQGVVA